jgi:predicted RNase H-like HicB family nuclease
VIPYDYSIILHPDDDSGYWTDVPALPGCGSQGRTGDEAIEMTKDAITGCIESLRKSSEPVPGERMTAVTVRVNA